MQRNWIEDLDSWSGFKYLRLKSVPMKHSKKGAVVDFSQLALSRMVAEAIIQSRVPIRGKELKLLRAVSKLSMAKFGQRLGVSNGAIYHWEKAGQSRLVPAYEVAIRLLCAELLRVDVQQTYSSLVGDERHDLVEVVVTRRKATGKPHQGDVPVKTRPSYRGHRKV